MNYNCARCGRAFGCAETISFCPFCGQAYMSAAQNVQAVPQRIVIGSDSERTVQEKYWKNTQATISSALLRLRRSLPRFTLEEESEREPKVPDQYKLPTLNVRDYKSLRKCTSISMFKAQMEEYLKKMEQSCSIHKALNQLAEAGIRNARKEIVTRRLSFELGEWSIEDLEDDHSIDVDREANYINGYCGDLAEVVGCMEPCRIQPELIYDPECVDWLELMRQEEDWDEIEPITAAHETLVRTVRESVDTVIEAINQNSLFVLSAMQFDVEEDSSPEALAERLKEFQGKDYDPIFGEPPERLIAAFSDAVVYVTNFLNGLPDYGDIMEATGDAQLKRLKERLEGLKLDALYGLIEAWSGMLSQELDKLYQSQSENMVDVYNAVEALKNSRQ